MFDTVFILLILLYLLNQFLEIKHSILISCILMLVPIFLRYGFGTDYFSYLHMYNRVEMSSLSRLLLRYEDIGIGFKLLIALAKEFNLSFQMFSIILNSISLIFIVLWIKDNSKDPLLSLILFYAMFYFVWILSAYRQGFVLALSMYFFFNKQKNLDIKTRILLIILLSLIHPSALFFILFYLLDKVTWTKRKHVILLGIAIVSTFLPIQKILDWLPAFSFVEKISSKYLDEIVRFYDFPGIVRLVFFIGIILFYESYDESDKSNYVDRFLYGTSIYFFLKFSEITAARSTIFTFFNLIILIPILMRLFIKFRHILLVPILAFSFIYYYKELNTMLVQAEYLGDRKYFVTETILNKNVENFGSRDSFEVSVREKTKVIKESIKDNQKVNWEKYKPSIDYIPVKVEDKYLLLSEEGTFLEGFEFSKKPSVYGDVVVTWEYEDGYFFTSPNYIDLSGNDRQQKKLKEDVLRHMEDNTHVKHRERHVKMDYSDIPHTMRDLYSNENAIKKINTNKFFEPFEYHIMTIHYHESKSYLYLDQYGNLLVKVPIKTARRYTSNIIRLETYEGMVYFNNQGKILWWE